MISFPRRLPARGRRAIVLTVAVLAALPLAAQEPSRDAAGESSGSLSHSARLRIDKTRQSLVAAARQRVASGEFAEAARLAQLVLEAADAPAHEVDFVLDDNVWVPASRAAANLLSRLPATARELVEDQATLSARAALDSARAASNPAELRGVALRFPLLAESAEAAFDLALRDLDRGEHHAAAAGFRRVVEHPRVSVSRRTTARALEIVALHRGGESRAARENWEEASELRLRAPRGMPAAIDPLRESVRRDLDRRFPAHERAVFPMFSFEDRADAALPSLAAVWRFEAPQSGEIGTLVSENLREAHGQGIALVPAAVPLVSGGLAAARILDDVAVFDLATGRETWRRSAGGQWRQLGGNLRVLQNDGLADLISRRLVYRLLADSLYSRLSGDGARLFGLVEGDSLLRTGNPRSVFEQGRNADPSVVPQHNWLAAWDVATGRELWRLGGPKPLPGDAPQAEPPHREQMAPAWANGVFFLGPPLVVDRLLFAIGQVENVQSLYAIHAATGELSWSARLVELSTAQPPGDARPLPPACPVALHRGVLLCPTANGCLAAVDLARREPLWAVRYPRSDFDRFGGGGPTQWNRQLQFPWWDAWREAVAIGYEDRAILAGPDSPLVQCFELTTGRRLWARPRGDGLFLAGIARGTLLIVERRGLAGVSVTTGETVWTAPMGPTAGRGHLGASTYLHPVASGGLVAIDAGTGRVAGRVRSASRIADWASTHATAPAFGNLITFPGGALSQTDRGLVRFSALEEQLAAAREAARARPDDRELAMRLARLETEAGGFDAAMALWKADRDDASRSGLRETLAVRLRESPRDAAETWAELEPLLDESDVRVAALDALARAHRDAGQPADALAAWMRLLERNPTGDSIRRASPGAERVVRFDRRVQGEIADLLAAAGAERRGPLDDLLRQTFQQALSSPDPFAVQRFVDHYGALELGRHARLRQATKAGIGIPFVESQLGLLELTADADRALAGRAWNEYAEWIQARGWRTDAALALRRLRDEFADVECDDSRTGRQIAAAASVDPLMAAAINAAPRDPWPAKRPAINVFGDRPRDAEFLIVPVESLPGALIERITVAVDRNGKRLRFSGGEQNAHWDLALPASTSMFRTAHPLHRGWGLGHLLVIRVGAELFGIAPLDERGDPNASVVWRHDLLGGRTARWNQLGVRLKPMPEGFGLDEVVVVDRFGRDLGQAGPVLPGLLCYRDQARLVALDPATGNRLWERFELPAGTQVAGDGARLVLWRAEEREVELVRALDGQTIATRTLDGSPGEDAVWFGANVLTRRRTIEPHDATAEHDEGPSAPALGVNEDGISRADGARPAAEAQFPAEELRLTEAATGRTLWSRSFARGARAFGLGPEHVGMVDPQGRLFVLRVESGEIAAARRVDAPPRIDRVFVACDERRFYVALGGPFANPNNQRIHQERGGYRNPGVNGRLIALNRADFSPAWSAALDDAALMLDQPREAPFLVLQFWQATDAENPTAVVRLVDKRTGEVWHETRRRGEATWFSIEPRADRRRIEYRDTAETVRLEFPE